MLGDRDAAALGQGDDVGQAGEGEHRDLGGGEVAVQARDPRGLAYQVRVGQAVVAEHHRCALGVAPDVPGAEPAAEHSGPDGRHLLRGGLVRGGQLRAVHVFRAGGTGQPVVADARLAELLGVAAQHRPGGDRHIVGPLGGRNVGQEHAEVDVGFGKAGAVDRGSGAGQGGQEVERGVKFVVAALVGSAQVGFRCCGLSLPGAVKRERWLRRSSDRRAR